jgi:extradiol dioxygenase family protein
VSTAVPSEPLFHLAFPVHDLEATEQWYVEGLGCRRGRRSGEAIVLDLGGHQLVAHRVSSSLPAQNGLYPRHFGLVFASRAELDALEARARRQGLRLGGEPRNRFPGTPLEHRSVVLIDPSGNWLEFKHYSDPAAITGMADLDQVGERGPAQNSTRS